MVLNHYDIVSAPFSTEEYLDLQVICFFLIEHHDSTHEDCSPQTDGDLMAQHKEGMVNKTGGDTTNSVGPCPAPPSRYSLLWNCCHMDSNAEGLNAIALLHKHLPNLPGSTNARVFTPLLLTQWDLTKPSLGEQEHLISHCSG